MALQARGEKAHPKLGAISTMAGDSRACAMYGSANKLGLGQHGLKKGRVHACVVMMNLEI